MKKELESTLRGLSPEKRAELRQRLLHPGSPDTRPIDRVARGGQLPLSFAETHLWFLERLDAGTTALNLPWALRLRGQLDLRALERGIIDLVERHESLRTRFASHQGELSRVIDARGTVALEHVSLRDDPTVEREAQARVTEQARRRFDLEKGPLFRATLLELGEQEHVLLLVAHRIVSDAWSRGVLTRELSVLYEAHCDGRSSPLPDLAIHYADYAAWERTPGQHEHRERQLGYWREHLSGLPAMVLPVARPRPATPSMEGAIFQFELSARLAAALRALARREGSTLFMVALAAFGRLLARISGQVDLAVGTPVANRASAGSRSVVGHFVNILVLRLNLGGSPTVHDLVERVRKETLSAFSRQDVPFERLVEDFRLSRDMSHSPLVQVVFAVEDQDPPPALADLQVESFAVETATSIFDMTLTLLEGHDSLRARIEYSSAMFDASMIERMAAELTVLFEAMVEQTASGEIPLTPIQRWFFELCPTDPHHWNMPVVFELGEAVEQKDLERALGAIVAHHDIFRIRFVQTSNGWRQIYGTLAEGVLVSNCDVGSLEERAASSQGSLSLMDGPLWRAISAREPRRTLLVLVLHHLITDAVSWRILRDDLEFALRAIQSGSRGQLSPPTTSVQRWSEQLASVTRSGHFDGEIGFWTSLKSDPPLPVDDVSAQNTQESCQTISVSLDVEHSRAILGSCHRAYGTRTHELLLAALGRALGIWTGRSSVLVELEGHGREEIGDGLDLSHTVGWFTSMFPVRLPAGTDAGEVVKATKEALQSIPRHGIGFGCLRYLHPAPSVRQRLSAVRAEVLFNFLGDFEVPPESGSLVAFGTWPIGPWRSPRSARSHLLEINGRLTRGRLHLDFMFSASKHRRETVQALASKYVQALEAIHEHCLSVALGP